MHIAVTEVCAYVYMLLLFVFVVVLQVCVSYVCNTSVEETFCIQDK